VNVLREERYRQAGIPQGTVLAPILYCLYINNTLTEPTTRHAVCGRYSYLRGKKTQTSCSLQTATRPQCSALVVRALVHKDQ
jgi:hypothetical protein